MYAALLVATLWVTHLAGQFSLRRYHQFALQPRRACWLILSYNWVHRDLRHLSLNSVPLLLFAWLSSIRGVDQFLLQSIIIWLIGGWGTWLFSTSKRVAGASGLVFGYWGLILTAAAISREPLWLAAALLTLLTYAGLWLQLGKMARGVSWASHFWGLVGGVVAALLTV
ncbi:MAG: rhomboid family intramembrane serine protease [Halieaceae bacterium]